MYDFDRLVLRFIETDSLIFLPMSASKIKLTANVFLEESCCRYFSTVEQHKTATVVVRQYYWFITNGRNSSFYLSEEVSKKLTILAKNNREKEKKRNTDKEANRLVATIFADVATNQDEPNVSIGLFQRLKHKLKGETNDFL